ncbi:MAG: type 4a pilus biogenesis protein PilO [Candidatus Omnitrophica bacterium]|nr:type 4a pilus biogenesis protein PilO [Candidatus Omnitrophota bacterium]
MVITTSKKVLLMTVLLGMFLFLATVKWVYEPRTRELKNLLKTLDEEHEKDRVHFEISKIKEDVEKRVAKEMLKSEKDLSWFLGKISEIFKSLGLELISLEPQTLERSIYYTNLPVKVKTICNYHALGELVSRLEGLDKFVEVSFLEIKTLKETVSKDKEEGVKKISSIKQVDDKGFVLLEMNLIIKSVYPNL